MSAAGPVTGAATPLGALLQRAEATPRNVAVRVFESGVWVEYGWDDVARTVARVASLASSTGVGSGSVVAIACGSRIEWSLAVWACSGLGAEVVAVPADADAATLAAVTAADPALWILEGARPADALDGLGGSGDTPRLVLDAVDLSADARRGVHEWERDVLDPVGSDDATRLADLRAAVERLAPDTVALRLPGEAGTAVTHTELVGSADTDIGAARTRLAPTDEYLAFLPPTWTAEAHILAGDHPVSGAVVSFGSRTGGGLREVATVQPTVLQAPSEWWEALAATVIRSSAEPAPFAKGALRRILDGGGDGLGVRLARRTLSRRYGLARLRTAVSLGAVGERESKVLDGLGVPMDTPAGRPRPLDVAGPPTDSDRLEEAR